MIKKISLCAVLAVGLNASGYKVPEQSNDAVSLLSSNVATSFGPDAAYYNPANMVFLPDYRHYFENDLAWFHINRLKFKANDGKELTSTDFDSMATTFHFVSPSFYEDWRFGLSLAVPAGIGIGWDDPDAAFTGKLFKLKVVELNPSVAYRLSDTIGVGVGLRAVYTKGKVVTEVYGLGDRHLKGDSVDYGYNLALSYKPTENLAFAATYRSKVDLSIKGDAHISGGAAFNALVGTYDGAVSVKIPLPAALVLATSYKINDTTLLFAYERTFWSDFKGYDFEYSGNKPQTIYFQRLFDDKVERNYRDTNTFRFGVNHDLNKKYRIMSGFVYDEKAAKDSRSASFDLPDTKAYAFSLGLNYQATENLELNVGGLYQYRKKSEATLKGANFSRGVPPALKEIKGEFDTGNVWIISSGLKYKF